MITTFAGENSFARGESLSKMIDTFVSEHGDLTLERLDGDEVIFESMQQSLTSLPFLSTKQLVVLHSPSKNKQYLEKFVQLLTAIPSSTDVIIIEPKLDKRLNYYKFLKKNTDLYEFSEPDQNGLVSWLMSAAKEKDGSIGSNDARYLVERIGAKQQLLAQELEKLILYNPQIDRHTINLLTEPIPQSSVFQLLEAAFKGQAKLTLDLYAEQRALKVEPQKIISMVAWQLRILALIKTAGNRSIDQIAQEASIHPFVVRKSQSIARYLSISELRDHVAGLSKVDTDLKRTKIDADEALRFYLLSLNTRWSQ